MCPLGHSALTPLSYTAHSSPLSVHFLNSALTHVHFALNILHTTLHTLLLSAHIPSALTQPRSVSGGVCACVPGNCLRADATALAVERCGLQAAVDQVIDAAMAKADADDKKQAAAAAAAAEEDVDAAKEALEEAKASGDAAAVEEAEKALEEADAKKEAADEALENAASAEMNTAETTTTTEDLAGPLAPWLVDALAKSAAAATGELAQCE